MRWKLAPVCWQCWRDLEAGKHGACPPIQYRSRIMERCHYCGIDTESGIYAGQRVA